MQDDVEAKFGSHVNCGKSDCFSLLQTDGILDDGDNRPAIFVHDEVAGVPAMPFNKSPIPSHSVIVAPTFLQTVDASECTTHRTLWKPVRGR